MHNTQNSKFSSRYVPFALLLVMVATGCRLGNRRVDAPQQDDSAQQAGHHIATGFYSSNLKSVNICGEVASTTAGQDSDFICAAATDVWVPPTISNVMKPFMGFEVVDTNTGSSNLFGVQSSPVAWEVVAEMPDAIKIQKYGESEWQKLWSSQTCEAQVRLIYDGVRKPHEGVEFKLPNGNTVKTIGSIQSSVMLQFAFQGDCKSTLALMDQCILNEAQCPGGSSDNRLAYRQDALRILGRLVEAQSLTVDQRDRLISVVYALSYE